jgi:2-polyprenyl-6-methoxyphenol hydroxylase-like FAD-dependent oxidoreductase
MEINSIMASMELRNCRIAIVGAGIAGLALAVALSRKGCHPVVMEQRERESLGMDGLFLSLAPNGMNALKALKLDQAIIDVGVTMSGLTLFNETGKRLGIIDYSRNQHDFGAPSVTIRRGALIQILLDAALALGVEIKFGSRVTLTRRTSPGFALEIGQDEQAFDAIIACDGLRSTMRRMAFPDAPEPVYTGLTGTGGVVDGTAIASTLGQMNMVFGRQAFFGYIRDEGGPAYWFDTYVADDVRSAGDWDSHAEAVRIAAMHKSDPLDIPKIVSDLTTIDRNYPIYDMPALSRWWRDNVLLIGDAAHAVAPHSGQGAAMALEDAIVLSECLADEPIPQAFQRFESLRRDRTAQATKLGRRSGSTKKAESWLSRRIRDWVLPLFLPMAGRMQAQLFRHRVDLNPLAMPER